MTEPRFIPSPPPTLSGMFSTSPSQNAEDDATRIFKQIIGDATKQIDSSLQSFKKEPSAQNASKLESAISNIDKQVSAFKLKMGLIKNVRSFLDNIQKNG